MKILKIELQNINSLKAEKPYTVDFENPHFKDIGLYAITGSTGAGKTTILDAITIALYHTAPRFNGQTKAGLEDVVSFGANFALARVTFENKGNKYEAQWSLRLRSNNDKKLKNPKEEVRLKNLSTEKIIAEKKTEVKTAIESICQLNYNQFLRSVMLAQGEFAAFLSASANEKGKLLEQITGETIYRRIGEIINQKIYDERKSLEQIQARINNDDLLSEEDRDLLKTEADTLLDKETLLNKDITQYRNIIQWYENSEKINAEKELLNKHFIELEHAKADKKEVIEALSLHEKAEPFKDYVEAIKRLEDDQINKSNLTHKSTNELTLLLPEIEISEKEINKHKQALNLAEINFNEWLPKLEQVSKLDAEIANYQAQKNKLDSENLSLNAVIKQLQTKELSIENNIQNNDKTIKQFNDYFDKSKHIPLVENKLNSWVDALKQRENLVVKIKDSVVLLQEKSKQSLFTKQALSDNIAKQEKEKHKLENLELKAKDLTTQIQTNDVKNTLKEKETTIQHIKSWEELKRIADTKLEISTQVKAIREEQKKLVSDLAKSNNELGAVEKELSTTNQLLLNAEQILALQRNILDFKEERAKLKANEPCPLCGSESHPLINEYEAIEIDETQATINQRKQQLVNIQKQEKYIAITIETTKTRMEHNDKLLVEFDKKVNHIDQQFKAIAINEKSLDITLIQNKIIQLTEKTNALNSKIEKAQGLQDDKNTNDKLLTQQLAVCNNLNTQHSVLIEKQNALADEIKYNEEVKGKANKELKLIEKDLHEEFNPLKLIVPNIEDTSIFIKNLSTSVSEYNANKNKLTEAEGLKKQLHSELLSIKNQLIEKQTNNKTILADLKTTDVKITSNTTARNHILPTHIKTNDKRNELQKSLDEHKNTFEKANKNLQNLQNKKLNITTTLSNLEKEIVLINKQHKQQTTELNSLIKGSIFNNQQAIIEALLDRDSRTKAQNIKTRIEERSIELNTTKKQINNGMEALEKAKNFDVSKDIAQTNLALFEKDKNLVLKRSGEIKQKIALDNQIIARNKDIIEAIGIQQKALKKWTDLINLLGGSKDAFNTYVQRLTLQQLIILANIHLYKLNKRYSLKLDEKYKKDEALNFKLVDHYQTNQTRYVDTSSGGEKFLISLSLALGLSDLASKNVSIDSLFIDEGFGTLDSKTLETVISSLETLQAQGKIIGIISHVENLKERIPTQIQVIKKSNGISTLEIV